MTPPYALLHLEGKNHALMRLNPAWVESGQERWPDRYNIIAWFDTASAAHEVLRKLLAHESAKGTP